MRPAVFLDRDGTIIEQVHHLNRVEDVAVYPFAADAMRLLRNAGYAIVIVTNQSVIGRGLLTIEGLEKIHDEMRRQLGSTDVIDGIYFSTSAPISSDRTVVNDPDRKPSPGLLLRAAKDLSVVVEESWMIGDMVSDLLAGRNAGCRGQILVRTGYGTSTVLDGAHGACPIATYIADDLLHAARLIVEGDAAAAGSQID